MLVENFYPIDIPQFKQIPYVSTFMAPLTYVDSPYSVFLYSVCLLYNRDHIVFSCNCLVVSENFGENTLLPGRKIQEFFFTVMTSKFHLISGLS